MNLFSIKPVLSFITSLIITLYILPKLSSIALKLGLIDYPDKDRKIHTEPKPLIGGIAIFIGITFSLILFLPKSLYRGLLAGMVTLIVFGSLDDVRELDHRLKFLIQITAALFLVYLNDTFLSSFGHLFSFGEIALGILSVPITILFIVGVINALNMIDGLDGLAGGISLVAFISFAVLALMKNQENLMIICLALSGALAAFLRYNWHPSRIFMGDAGSQFLGFCLAAMALALTSKEIGVITIPFVVPLLILAVPIVDTATTMIRRILNRKNPFAADKYHLHHLILRYGINNTIAVILILIVSVLLSAFAIIGTLLHVPEHYMFGVFIVYSILHFIVFFRSDAIKQV